MKLHRLPARTKGGVHVVVESPRGAQVKLKYEPDAGAFFAQRALPLGYAYPYDWGFIPGTEGPDGDPLDVLVYWDVASAPGAVIRCRLLGVLELDQRADGARVRNDRIIAVPLGDERTAELRSVKDLPKRVRVDLENYFTSSVYFTSKSPRVRGWSGPEEAEALVEGSVREADPRGRRPRGERAGPA